MSKSTLRLQVRKFLKNKLKSLPKILTLTIPAVIFFVWVWLLFVRLQKDVVVEIENLISKNRWIEVIQSIESILEKNDRPQVHLYVFGSVAKFGLEEKKKLKQEDINNLKNIRDYNYELIRRDSTGIYLRESFFYRFRKFPRSKRFTKLLCEYLDYFPDALEHEKKFQQLFLTSLSPEVNWTNIDPICLRHMFDKRVSFLKTITRSPIKKSRPMRMQPYMNSKLIRNVRPKERVFIREKYGVNEAINTEQKKWLYIIDELGRSGWVLSKNFSNF